jgi:hypothetical protein
VVKWNLKGPLTSCNDALKNAPKCGSTPSPDPPAPTSWDGYVIDARYWQKDQLAALSKINVKDGVTVYLALRTDGTMGEVGDDGHTISNATNPVTTWFDPTSKGTVKLINDMRVSDIETEEKIVGSTDPFPASGPPAKGRAVIVGGNPDAEGGWCTDLSGPCNGADAISPFGSGGNKDRWTGFTQDRMVIAATLDLSVIDWVNGQALKDGSSSYESSGYGDTTTSDGYDASDSADAGSAVETAPDGSTTTYGTAAKTTTRCSTCSG